MALECLNCSHMNTDEAKLCANCGMSLYSVAHIDPLATETLVFDNIEVAKKARSETGSEEFIHGMVLNIHVEGFDKIIRIRPSEAILLGRADPRLRISPEVDLTDYGAPKKGVSRSHAALRVVSDTLYVIDMNSSNGTFHRGERLDAGKPRVVRDGDVVQLGELVLTLRFEN